MAKYRIYVIALMCIGAIALYATWLIINAPNLVSQADSDSSGRRETRLRMARLVHWLDVYRRDHGKLPQGLDQAAVEITDPWRRPFHYVRLADGEYELFSNGPDGEAHTTDDVRRERSLDAEFDTQALAEAEQEGLKSIGGNPNKTAE